MEKFTLLGKAIECKSPNKNDYHEKRYGEVFGYDENKPIVYVVSWFDSFVGYEVLMVPIANIIGIGRKIKDEYERRKMQKAIEEFCNSEEGKRCKRYAEL
jgi:Xaa-Pro aminopeptidase